jgi:hypothetical protein
MTMEVKRFGLGLLAGFVLAFAVVAVSGGLGPALGPSSFSPSLNTSSSSTFYITSTTAYATLSVTAATTTVSSSSSTLSGVTSEGSAAHPLSGNGTTATRSTTTAISISSSSTVPTPSNEGSIGLTTAHPGYSSRIDSISQQPLLSTTIILIPVLVAFFLGAFLYRVSVRDREERSP